MNYYGEFDSTPNWSEDAGEWPVMDIRPMAQSEIDALVNVSGLKVFTIKEYAIHLIKQQPFY